MHNRFIYGKVMKKESDMVYIFLIMDRSNGEPGNLELQWGF